MVKQDVSIIGVGYVGLCTAIAFAKKGYRVIAVDYDYEKIALVKRGILPFYERGLETALKHVLKKNCLECSLNYDEAILKTDITFITVGTPSKPDGSIDLQYIKTSAREIGDALRKKEDYHLVVVKSTVIPGTTENVVKPIIEKFSGKQCGDKFGICVNPEFLREGRALHDTLNPDRIIIGEYDRRSGDTLENFYRRLHDGKMSPVIRTNLATAEMIKYANNAFLATKISFINQIANICERIEGVDVTVVAKAIGLDKRIGPLFLNAGIGYGGSCLPKDIKALINFSKSLGYEPKLLEAVDLVNETQYQRVIDFCKSVLGNIKGKRIAILGLAFKPDTDDIRGAISIKIIKALLREEADIIAYDPAAMHNVRKKLGNSIKYADSPINCIKNADCCIIVTEWEQFKKLKPNEFIQNMRRPFLIDGRRIFDPMKYGSKLEFKAIGLG